jgi:hypothetical protein
MERAFAPGYDPVLELAAASSRGKNGEPVPGRVRRKEQDYVDKLINGEVTGECASPFPSALLYDPL